MTGIVNDPTVGKLNRVTQTINFANSPWKNIASGKKLFIVSGFVFIRLTAACVATLTNASGTTNMKLGITDFSTTALIGSTNHNSIVTNSLWYDAATSAPTVNSYTTITAGSPMIFVTSKNITVSVESVALTGGSINFICDWYPITVAATVSAGDGTV